MQRYEKITTWHSLWWFILLIFSSNLIRLSLHENLLTNLKTNLSCNKSKKWQNGFPALKWIKWKSGKLTLTLCRAYGLLLLDTITQEGGRRTFMFTWVMFTTTAPLFLSVSLETIMNTTNQISIMQKNGRKKSQLISIDDMKQIVIDSEEQVWTVETLAQMLGISAQGVRKRILKGLIPAHKEGRLWYVLKSEYISNLRSK